VCAFHLKKAHECCGAQETSQEIGDEGHPLVRGWERWPTTKVVYIQSDSGKIKGEQLTGWIPPKQTSLDLRDN
jgi:hypothetical protein